MRRRDFLKRITLAVGSMATGATPVHAVGARQEHPRVTKQQALKPSCSVSHNKTPVAIAMWDFSWLLRHHPCGEFEDWDDVLDGLVSRGYNAVRIDAFPNLVAADSDGRVVDTYEFPKGDWKPAMWGNNVSTRANPRQAMREFIPRCIDRGILIGLSTWFVGPGAGKIKGLDAFVRVWDETLTFMKSNDLLHNIYYIDLLNEYPLFSGFAPWLRGQMDSNKKASVDKRAEAISDPEDRARKVHEWSAAIGDYNDAESLRFRVDFANNAIDRLKVKWPGLDFIFSFAHNGAANWKDMDFSHIAALDIHYWFVMNDKLPNGSGYWENIHNLANNDLAFANVQKALLQNWRTHKDELVAWMDAEMAAVAEVGRRHNRPVGNTEGWGAINWLDHPSLTWDIIKQSAEICARLGRKHGYRFNCTSNFTHPQFPRLWQDVAWHRRVTDIIRHRGD